MKVISSAYDATKNALLERLLANAEAIRRSQAS